MSVETNCEVTSTENGNCPIRKKFDSPTIRLSLTLREPDTEFCSVFNYKALIAEEERNRRREKEERRISGLLDVNGEEEYEVQRLAQHFLDKYGNGSTRKKRKKKAPTFYNYTELATGYDESDSFIDNSEAFDEALPDEMETLHGGYYVNIGQLEFKKVEINDETSDLDEIRVSKKKNCVLKSDDSGSDAETLKSNEDESKTEGDDEEEAATKKSPEMTNQEVERENSKTVSATELSNIVLKDISVDTIKLNGDVSKKRKKNQKRHLNSDGAQIDFLPKVKKKVLTVKSLLEEKRIVENGDSAANSFPKSTENAYNSINDAIESVINAARNEDSRDSLTSSSDTKSIDSQTSEETEKENHPDEIDVLDITMDRLPGNLCPEVLELVSQIKCCAQNTEIGGRAFFNSSVNSTLLNLEANIRSLKTATRHSLYEYLASFLPCSKDTLIKRAKKLIVEEEERYIVEPYNKLKTCIERTMPTILDNYTAACQQVADEKNVGNFKNSDKDDKTLSSKIPTKKFVWTEESRGYLRELVSCRTKCFHMLKPRKESVEEYLKKFLRTKVEPLWPPGWMNTSALLEEAQYPSAPMKIKLCSSFASPSVASCTVTISSTKKSNFTVPTSSNTASTSLAASPSADYSSLKNSVVALQPSSVAVQYPIHSQANASYSTAPSDVIPYRPDLNLMGAAAPLSTSGLPVSVDVFCRMTLDDPTYTTAMNSHASLECTSPPKVRTTPSPSYQIQRPATPVGQRLNTPVTVATSAVATLLPNTAYCDKKKSCESFMSKSNDLFKIDSLINTSKTKKEHQVLNHILQYNKHYSHKTEKRKKDSHALKKKIGNSSSSSSNSIVRINGIIDTTTSAFRSALAPSPATRINNENSAHCGGMGMNGRSNTSTSDQVLDLSPNKVKVECMNDDVRLKFDHQNSEVEASVATVFGLVTVKDHSYWRDVPSKDMFVAKKDDTELEKQSSIQVPYTSPEVMSVPAFGSSKPIHISRKQRLLQETAKMVNTDLVVNALPLLTASDCSNAMAASGSSTINIAVSSQDLLASTASAVVVAAAAVPLNKQSDAFVHSKKENTSSASNEKHLLDESKALTVDIIHKIIDDSLRNTTASPRPQFKPKFATSNTEAEMRLEESFTPSVGIYDSKLKLSSKDSCRSPSSPVIAERRTPTVDRADVDATDVIKDLLALNQSIPRRSDLEPKKHDDFNSLMNQPSLPDKSKTANLPRMNLTGFQNEFFKHIYNKVDEHES